MHLSYYLLVSSQCLHHKSMIHVFYIIGILRWIGCLSACSHLPPTEATSAQDVANLTVLALSQSLGIRVCIRGLICEVVFSERLVYTQVEVQ